MSSRPQPEKEALELVLPLGNPRTEATSNFAVAAGLVEAGRSAEAWPSLERAPLSEQYDIWEVLERVEPLAQKMGAD